MIKCEFYGAGSTPFDKAFLPCVPVVGQFLEVKRGIDSKWDYRRWRVDKVVWVFESYIEVSHCEVYISEVVNKSEED